MSMTFMDERMFHIEQIRKDVQFLCLLAIFRHNHCKPIDRWTLDNQAYQRTDKERKKKRERKTERKKERNDRGTLVQHMYTDQVQKRNQPKLKNREGRETSHKGRGRREGREGERGGKENGKKGRGERRTGRREGDEKGPRRRGRGGRRRGRGGRAGAREGARKSAPQGDGRAHERQPRRPQTKAP